MGGGLTEEDVRQAVKELAVVGVIRQIAKPNASPANGPPRTRVSRNPHIEPHCQPAVESARIHVAMKESETGPSAKSFDDLRDRAEVGDPEAQYDLAVRRFHDPGGGVEPDVREAPALESAGGRAGEPRCTGHARGAVLTRNRRSLTAAAGRHS